MAPLWSIATRVLTRKSLKTLRLSSGPLHKTGTRALTSTPSLWNIVTSSIPDVQPPSGNLINTLFEDVHRWGTRTAMECSVTGHQYTYNQLLDGMAKWAGFLTKFGLEKGDVIAMTMFNCPEYPIVLLGAVSIGVIVTTINPSFATDEIVRQLKNSRAQLVVGHPSLETALLSTQSHFGKRPLHIIMNGPSTGPGTLNLQEILKDTSIPYVDPAELTGEETAMLPYSSGTTGLPKGVSVSHNAFSIGTRRTTHPSVFSTKTTTTNGQESYLCVLPLFHMYGICSYMMSGLNHGVKLLMVPKFDPKNFVSLISKNKVETLHLVPPLLHFLNHSPDATSDTLASLKSVCLSAAPVAPSAGNAFKEKVNKQIFFQEAFGMTEAHFISATPLNEERIGTTGKLLPNTSAKVIDTITGENLPSNQTGELCFKTPSMSRYYRNEDVTSSLVDNEGWMHSGDIGFFDEDGYMTIVDRKKDIIKVKGFQVSPSELEEVVSHHPQVLDVGVVGVPHDLYGEVPKAYIVTKTTINEDEIHSFMESRVAPYKKLAGGITFVQELPTSPSGKLLRRKLKELDSH